MMEYLSDIDKINFLKTCSSLYNYRFDTKFHDFHLYNKICNLDYRENFKKKIYVCKKVLPKFFVLENSYDRIPIDVKYLIVRYSCKFSLENIIPWGITHLTIESGYDIEINPGEIPDTVTHLDIRSHFHIIKKGAIPGSVTHLYINGYCDGLTLKDIIPKNVVYLGFGYNIHGEFGEQIIETQEIDGKTITTTKILSHIPDNIIKLHICSHMQEKLGKQLTETQEINGKIITSTRILSYIPDTVISLILYGCIYKNTFDFIPKNLTSLKLYGNIEELIDETIIPKITTLGLLSYRDGNLISFPKTVNNLKILASLTDSKIAIFGHVSVIEIPRYDYFAIKNRLRENVIPKNLPCNIKTLTINEEYDKNIIKNIPNTINTLIFKHNDLMSCLFV
ncbi:putative FNIP repeat-containing protein [Acanthamoeba polyphaga mimivirus]|uniref:FNIP repeat-containing protein n=1 Tax=Acanthamoeba polyphaga mimivirus Kroon TaxID=3069720 RepID=A0A0G2Y317_9VIRU|nr:putative FNIP repeat-containing protein [Acanthamoeba polyphaga mimivirus]AKI80148.1 putative FNIP repeat-containing protein [Acanthamoeba polyphaga mimivirus Kroon]